MLAGDTFSCGHPRSAENSQRTSLKRKSGEHVTRCKLCARASIIVAKVKRDQARINAGTFGAYTIGLRIAAGLNG